MTGYLEWLYAVRCLRLAHVAAHRDYWTDCVEMYAWEGGNGL